MHNNGESIFDTSVISNHLSPLTSRASFSFSFFVFLSNFHRWATEKKGYDLCIGLFEKKKPKVAIFQEEKKVELTIFRPGSFMLSIYSTL
jgi:hypothetical protein